MRLLMKIEFKLKELDFALENQSNSHNYYLFMLGTDTFFTPEPTKNYSKEELKKTYENGETLSYTAQVMASCLDEETLERDKNSPLSFNTSSVAVIDGPTTLGSEVGDRIARGVFLILKAVLSGQSNIQISAHSRGAVESILIAHEIDRIKKALKEKPKAHLYSLLLNTPCSYTKAAFQTLLGKEQHYKFQNFENSKLMKGLHEAKLNLFLMDPVPGGSWYIVPTGWSDERFYKEIPCNSAQLLLFRDERTKCFIPIVPNGIKPIIIPGHHGTASGNLYTQQLQKIPDQIEHRDTSTVQKLVLCCLFNFINQSSTIFKQNYPKDKINLKHDELDKITNEFLFPEQQDQKKLNKLRSGQLLRLYSEVQKNNLAFKYFEKTSYNDYALGREVTSTGNRFVHYQGNNYIDLSTLGSLQGQFVNSEHALIYLSEIIGFAVKEDKAELMELIIPLKESFNQLFDAYLKDETPVLELLDNEITRTEVFNAISSVVENICQVFLRNHLSLDVKTNMMESIRSVFLILNQHQGKDDKKPIFKYVDESKNILKNAIKKTADIQAKSLIEQSSRIYEEINLLPYASKPEFNQAYEKLISHLNFRLNEFTQLETIIQKLEGLKEKSPESVSKIINDEINELGKNKDNSAVVNYLIDGLSDKNSNLWTCIAASSLDEKVIFEDLSKLYENIFSLIDGKKSIIELIAPLELDFSTRELFLHQSSAVILAAQLIVKNQKYLEKIPENLNISKEFFELVLKQSIALGVQDPKLTSALQRNKEFENQISLLQQDKMRLNHQVEESQLKISEMSANIQLKDNQIDALERQVKQFSQDKLLLADQLRLQEELFESTKHSLSQEKEQVQISNNQFDNLKLANQKLEKSFEEVQQELNKNKQAVDDLNQKMIEKNDQLEKKGEEIQQKIETTQKLESELQNHSQTILTLKGVLTKKDELLKRQNDKLDQNIEDIHQLSKKLKDSEQQIIQLDEKYKRLITDQEKKISEVNAMIQTKINEIDKLTQQKEDLNVINGTFKKELDDKTLQLTLAEDKQKEQQDAIQKLDSEFKLFKKHSETSEENQHQMMLTHEQLIKELNSEKEIKCAILIQTKLLPYTENYLSHLSNKISEHATVEPQDHLDKITVKQNRLLLLKEHLTNSEQNKLPSQRIEAFAKELRAYEKDIEAHRNSSWVRYTKNCLIAMSIVCTGLIPGLLAILGYSYCTGESLLFFSKSHGERFVQKVETDLPVLTA